MPDDPAAPAATEAAASTTMPIEVAKSVAATQLRAQARLALAALAGALVGKHILPADLVNDTMLDAVSALVFAGLASAWQWARTGRVHAWLRSLAVSRQVPDTLIRPKESGK